MHVYIRPPALRRALTHPQGAPMSPAMPTTQGSDITSQPEIAAMMRHTSQEQPWMWITDHEAPCCLQCGRRFGVMTGRRHCQLCRVAVCADCCNQRLPERPNVKVCRLCYDFNLGNNTLRMRVRPPPTEVHRGWLVKQGSVIKSWKRRLFVLDSNGVLSYFKNDPDDAGSMAVPAGTINTAACIKLDIDAEPASVTWPAGCKVPSCGILLQGESRTYRMYAESPAIAMAWGRLLGVGALLCSKCGWNCFTNPKTPKSSKQTHRRDTKPSSCICVDGKHFFHHACFRCDVDLCQFTPPDVISLSSMSSINSLDNSTASSPHTSPLPDPDATDDDDCELSVNMFYNELDIEDETPAKNVLEGVENGLYLIGSRLLCKTHAVSRITRRYKIVEDSEIRQHLGPLPPWKQLSATEATEAGAASYRAHRIAVHAELPPQPAVPNTPARRSTLTDMTPLSLSTAALDLDLDCNHAGPATPTRPRTNSAASTNKHMSPERKDGDAADLVLCVSHGIAAAAEDPEDAKDPEANGFVFVSAPNSPKKRQKDKRQRLILPKGNRPYMFVEHESERFAQIRNELGINPDEFAKSFNEPPRPENVLAGGRSGSYLVLSNDQQYVLKTLPSSERLTLLHMLDTYHKHVTANPNTLLAKFVGLYEVRLPGALRYSSVILMTNVVAHAGERVLHEMYDLKGSYVDRRTITGSTGRFRCTQSVQALSRLVASF